MIKFFPAKQILQIDISEGGEILEYWFLMNVNLFSSLYYVSVVICESRRKKIVVQF